MSIILEEARKLVNDRLAEIGDERKRLERALVELAGVNHSGKRRGPGRPKGSKTTTGAGTSRTASGRKRRQGTRRDQALKLIAKSPGISASEIAKALKLKPNYLYRVLGELEKEKLVVKDGRSYSPAPVV